MYNYYISQMKDLLKNYYKKEMEYQSQREEVQKRFSSEYAKAELSTIREKSNSSYFKYQKAVTDLFYEVRELLAVASFPDSGMVPAVEADFFRLFNPTAEEVRMKIAQYRDNFSMQRFISDWIEQKESEYQIKNDTPWKYADCKTYTPADHLKIYLQFTNSCLDMLNSIHYAPQNVSQTAVDAYADDRFSGDLYAVIGDGDNLKQYRNKSYYEFTKNTFDSVNVNV